jgi:excinuclease ABC subunit B
VQAVAETRAPYAVNPISKEEISQLIRQLESQMKSAAKNLEFEKAAMIRDRIIELRRDDELYSPIAEQ